MKLNGVAAVAAILLLGACREAADNPSNSPAAGNSTASEATANSANSAAPVSPEQAKKLFHERHEGMEDIGDATKAIGRQLKSDAPDLAVVRKSAATINDLAPKSADWFPAGTGTDILPKTRAKAEIWQKPDDFTAKDRDFQQAAQTFKAAADAGDLAAIKSRFEALGKTCKACHDSYRAEKHPK